jgi:hypothetical protein
MALLREHRELAAATAKETGTMLADRGFVFSLATDHGTFIDPSSTTQRYDRMSSRLKINSTLHKLRHYSATELLNAGVNIRAAAGRLGHGGGGRQPSGSTRPGGRRQISEPPQSSPAECPSAPQRPQVGKQRLPMTHPTANLPPPVRTYRSRATFAERSGVVLSASATFSRPSRNSRGDTEPPSALGTVRSLSLSGMV